MLVRDPVERAISEWNDFNSRELGPANVGEVRSVTTCPDPSLLCFGSMIGFMNFSRERFARLRLFVAQ